MDYGYRKKVSMSFPAAMIAVKKQLVQAGFGILTEIDVQQTLKMKLQIDREPYIILGACNPPLAHRALQVEPEIGLFLPCNVIVYESDGAVIVSAIVPSVAMGMIKNSSLVDIAKTVEDKLMRVIDAL